jgi:hypothetical protein
LRLIGPAFADRTAKQQPASSSTSETSKVRGIEASSCGLLGKPKIILSRFALLACYKLARKTRKIFFSIPFFSATFAPWRLRAHKTCPASSANNGLRRSYGLSPNMPILPVTRANGIFSDSFKSAI